MNLFCPYFSFETQNWIFQEYKLHIIIYTFETCFKLLNYFSHSLLTRWHALFSLFPSSTIVLWIQKTTQEFSFLSSSLLFLVSKKNCWLLVLPFFWFEITDDDDMIWSIWVIAFLAQFTFLSFFTGHFK